MTKSEKIIKLHLECSNIPSNKRVHVYSRKTNRINAFYPKMLSEFRKYAISISVTDIIRYEDNDFIKNILLFERLIFSNGWIDSQQSIF